MRKIRGSVFVSLDGVIQAPGGPTEDRSGGFAHGGWLAPLFDEEVGAAIDRFYNSEYDLLLGRRTYEIFAAYWPYVGGGDEQFDAAGKSPEEAGTIDMGAAFTRAAKYVLTSGEPDLGWSNSHKLASLDELARLKRGEGPDLLIQGSGTLYPQLLAAGLIDELTLMTFPVVVGSGKRLFGDETPLTKLELTDHKLTRTGAMIATYRPAGTIEPVAIGPPIDSARERVRQQTIAAGRW